MRTIGIDFDNTIVNYGELFLQLASEAKLFEPPFAGTRSELRASLRARGGGEGQWQALQALAYGPRIKEACLYPGTLEFIDRALSEGYVVRVVSHKTEYAAAAPNGPSLRESALEFMADNGLLGPGRLSVAAVSFANSRRDKLREIERVSCDVFIDDLEEVLLDESFPRDTRPILFSPQAPAGQSEGNRAIEVAATWAQIATFVLG